MNKLFKILIIIMAFLVCSFIVVGASQKMFVNLDMNSYNITNIASIFASDWTNVSVTLSQVSDFVEGDLNVNSSAYWDSLNSPSDISTGDLTDDGTYVAVVGDTMTGELIVPSLNSTGNITVNGLHIDKLNSTTYRIWGD